ncbi:MAG: exodeoxyribonuclease VII small subunit [Bdellovibrionales bacterium]|nr:exodeoxyribonuclease VII small subunit [Bdellovibrionales bacterium]
MSVNFEKKMEKLEEIVTAMEAGDLQLDEALKMFEEGVKLSRECNDHLNKAEEKVRLLLGVDEKGQPITEEFDS